MENTGKHLLPGRDVVCRRLRELADEEYRQFHSRLCPGTERILGVRTPKLRTYAREIIKEYGQQVVSRDFYTLQADYEDLYYEEKVLTGMLLGLWKAPSLQEMERMLRLFLPLIDNWAVCDITCGGLKYIGKHREYFYPVLQEYLKSREAYTVRFGVVLLMNYYMDEAYVKELFLLYEQIHHEDYYVKMAVAWAYSMLLIKFYPSAYEFLKDCSLDRMTFQKTIQKACESRRITDVQRQELRELKKIREQKA